MSWPNLFFGIDSLESIPGLLKRLQFWAPGVVTDNIDPSPYFGIPPQHPRLLRVKNYLEGFQELFQHFDARCLSVADSGPTQQYELQ